MAFKFHLFVITLFNIFFISSKVTAQPDSSLFNRIIKNVSDQLPTEKIYLHLDESNYYPGDTIWYKVYTVTGPHHQLSALSGVLYVELFTPKDSLVTRQILQMHSGVSISDIPLPLTLKNGNYRIRAYTNWMRNFGPEHFYKQNIKILGITRIAPVVKAIEVNPDVRFFPEGGQLVNGLRSRVAVKAVGSNGLGVDIRGNIEDNNGNVVASFSTQHLGMGVFAFMPQIGKVYKATVKAEGGVAFAVNIPIALEEGYTLSVNNRGADSLYIKLAVSEQMLSKYKNSAFYIVGQSNDKIYFTAEGTLNDPLYITKVEKRRFPSGIARFTLFSQSGEPVAERISFVENDDTIGIKLITHKGIYGSRQQVKIDLEAQDKSNAAITGSFSVAVINESRAGLDVANESTIFNSLLLTSELKGYVEKPQYYFINRSDQTKADLDVLLLTQGYRSFELKRLTDNPNIVVSFKPEKYLELSGTLKTPSGTIVPNGKITMMASKQNILSDTTTDINGDFKFDNLFLPDTSKIILRARKANNGSKVNIYVKQPDYPALIKTGETDVDGMLPSKLSAIAQKDNADFEQHMLTKSSANVKSLNEVTINSTKIAKPDIFNNYGTSLEFDLDMKKIEKTDLRITDALRPYLMRVIVNSLPTQIMVDGLEQSMGNFNFFSPKEVESIRLIDASGLSPAKIMLTTKRYAGTDTVSSVRLKQVTIKATKMNSSPDLSRSSNLHGGGNADQVIMGDKIEGCITISECLQGKVVGVTFGQDGTPHSFRNKGSMVIIVDGNVLPGNTLNNLNADDVYSIEVLRSGAYLSIYGSSAGGGALIITLKHGESNNYITSDKPAGLITYSFNGFYKARSFYSPKYDVKTVAQAADLRNTVYWNPNIITDNDGKAAFEYFNNDSKGTYRMVIEGIDSDGNLGRQVFRYKVE